MKSYTNGENGTRLPYVYMKLFNFEIQNVVKSYVHSHIYFLMPGQILREIMKASSI